MTAAIDHNTRLVSQLITSCNKAENRFRSAAKAVEDPTLKRLFEIYAQQRTRFAEELREHMPFRDEPPSEDEDLSGQQTASTAGELIRNCLETETRTLALYKEALAHRSIPIRAHFLISAQLALLERVHDRIDAMLRKPAANLQVVVRSEEVLA